jgi:hypothetical protein
MTTNTNEELYFNIETTLRLQACLMTTLNEFMLQFRQTTGATHKAGLPSRDWFKQRLKEHLTKSLFSLESTDPAKASKLRDVFNINAPLPPPSNNKKIRQQINLTTAP